jgi:hypothetical protein
MKGALLAGVVAVGASIGCWSRPAPAGLTTGGFGMAALSTAVLKAGASALIGLDPLGTLNPAAQIPSNPAGPTPSNPADQLRSRAEGSGRVYRHLRALFSKPPENPAGVCVEP